MRTIITFNDSAQLYFTAGFYCLHGKVTAVWDFTDRSEICTEVTFTLPKVMWRLIRKLPFTEVKYYPEVKSQTLFEFFSGLM